MVQENRGLRKDFANSAKESSDLRKQIDEMEAVVRKLKDESVSMHLKSKSEFTQAQNEIRRELA